VLAPRVEHVAGARLDDDSQIVPLEQGGYPGGASSEFRCERDEVREVEGQGDPVLAEVG
jgi:hypothetical protein